MLADITQGSRRPLRDNPRPQHGIAHRRAERQEVLIIERNAAPGVTSTGAARSEQSSYKSASTARPTSGTCLGYKIYRGVATVAKTGIDLADALKRRGYLWWKNSGLTSQHSTMAIRLDTRTDNDFA